MSNSTENPPVAPTGIEPDVLLQINALFREPEMIMRPVLRRQDSADSSEAWWKKHVPPAPVYNEPTDIPVIGGATAANSTGDETHIEDDNLGLNQEDFRLPLSEDGIEEYYSTESDSLLAGDQVPGTEDISSSTQVVDPYAPTIMARYIYPSERRLDALPPPSAPARLSTPSVESSRARWPDVSFLITSVLKSIIDFVMDDDVPGVIEYSDAEVKQMINEIQVEARVIERPSSMGSSTPAPEKVIGIVALVPVGGSEPPQLVSITAKPKRVRQLLKDYGVRNVAEDVYGLQIREALKSLHQAG